MVGNVIRQLKAETPKELFFKKAPVAILINIFEKSPTFSLQIWRETNVDTPAINKIIKIFKKYDLITISKKTGRTKYISITEQGKDLAGSVMAIIGSKKVI